MDTFLGPLGARLYLVRRSMRCIWGGGLTGKETLTRAFTVINKRALFSFPEFCFSSPLVITMFLSGKPKGVGQDQSSFHLCIQITSKLLKL